jgi:uncharacterized protein (DUF3820 family)
MNEPGNKDQNLLENRAFLEKLLKTRMPFGKFKGRLLIDLPEPYVAWFARKGFPRGELGKMLQIVHEIKINGLEYLFDPLRR